MKTWALLTLILYSVTLSAQERITLLFVGDLMQHQAQIDAARTPQGTYDYTPCFSLVGPQIQAADIAVGNLEVTLGGRPYKGYPAFSAPDEYLHAIRDAGFDVLLTANNHCLDPSCSPPTTTAWTAGRKGWSARSTCSTPCRYLRPEPIATPPTATTAIRFSCRRTVSASPC